jgi:hypothetical protein
MTDNKVHYIKCSYLVIDNFYSNPDDTRKFILTQEFKIRGNYPGKRTISFADENTRDCIQKYISAFAGKITRFEMGNDNTNYNGSFQYTTSRDRSWIHTDSWNNWAAVLYLTPNAPESSGTGLYKYKDGTKSSDNLSKQKIDEIDEDNQDLTKWTLVDRIGNVYNRMVIFNAKQYHCSLDYFGTNKENGRLFQVFFFSTEK